MKKRLVLCLMLCVPFLGSAQAYKFTTIKEVAHTPVKDQGSTGTCWCFATISFVESELIRKGKGEHDLSEMFTVRHNYKERIADNYMRRGKGNLGEGSICHMTIDVIAEHGMVPESVYSGMNYESDFHNHGALNAFVNAIAEVSVKKKMRTPEYMELENALLDIYLGEVPEKFTYDGVEYTPKSFAEAMDFNPSDYIQITSFNHHPYYEEFSLEIPDNWNHAGMLNLPLDEFLAVIDNSIENGYSVVWDGDVSENGYLFAMGISVMPKNKDLYSSDLREAIAPEMEVTQELRQELFESFKTTDDHLEHIVGISEDQECNKYYLTKNSWGADANKEFKGYHHMSVAYVAAKTTSILVHKNAIPKKIRKKIL